MLPLILISFLLGGASVLPLWGTHYWWVRILDFPRVHLASLSLLAVLAHGVWVPANSLQWGAFLFLVAGFVLDGYRMFPYSPLASKESKGAQKSGAPDLHILSINVRQKNQNSGKVLSLIKKESPDLVLLLETDQPWTNDLASLDDQFQSHHKVPLDNAYGMLFYSNLKVISMETRHLNDETVPSLRAEIGLPNGDSFYWLGLHPRPPRPQEGHSHQRDGELMTVALEIQKKPDRAYIVCGDLNDVAWSHTTRLFRRVSGLKDPRVGRGLYNTFPAVGPFPPSFPLDHIFHSKHFELKDIRRLGDIGSDHYPLSVKLICNLDSKGSSKEPDTGDIKNSKKLKDKGESLEPPRESESLLDSSSHNQ